MKDKYHYHVENHKDKYIPIEQKFIIKVLKNVLEVLVYFLKQSILHRDIKPDNILFDKNNDVKISDFGISALFRDGNSININKDEDLFGGRTRCGPKVFTPPEIYNNKKQDFRCDIYSLGLTIKWLMSSHPIEEITDMSIRDINNMDISYNLHLRRLVLRMIDDDLNLRPYACHAQLQLQKIEQLIDNPQDIISKKYLDKIDEDFKNLKKNQSQNNIQNNPPNIQFFQNVNKPNIPNFQQIPNNFNFPMNMPQINNIFQNNRNIAFNQNYNNQFINQFMQMLPQTFIPINQNNPFKFTNIQNNRMANSGDKIVVASKNTSFIRVLQCLYYIVNVKMKEFKFLITNMYKKIGNNSFSMKIIEVLELFNTNSFKDKNFSNNIQKYRNLFALDIIRFRGNDEINPWMCHKSILNPSRKNIILLLLIIFIIFI